ncbi:hypothetical protein A4G20_05070 [Pasteurellaceae bacterium RH1A]|nr:hypothetical protein A4G20_05070 [Pasteurellaceae bacterium RH1A]
MTCQCQKLTTQEPNLCLPLTQYRLIEIAGADAEKYLQGQLTCDVAKLEIGQQTLTSHCDPKGKMSAIFRLYRARAEQFVALIHADLLPEALVQLKKYAVFSKVTFTELDTPIFGTTSGSIFAEFCKNATACKIEGGQTRYLLWGDLALQTNGEAELWELMDIQDGLPVLLKPNQFEHIPQAVNLQALDQAISFSKGCYIGQETVARAKYRGANKRAMFTLAGHFENEIVLPETAASVELQLGENWKSTGTILRAIAHQNTLWVQVILNKDIEPDSRFRVNGVELAICPLPYSLTD